jgi:protein phosphatase 1 regulatory subunit 7
MLFTNPSLGELRTLLRDVPDSNFRIQFSEPGAYDNALLGVVDEICRSAGQSVSIRFYGHYASTIDCAVVSRLPACRSLFLDCLQPLANVEAIAGMQPLQTFGINIFEANYDQVLRYPSVQATSTLFIGTNRKTDWDLQSLGNFANLRTLNVGGQHKNIAVLGEMNGIRSLWLHSIPRKSPLAYVSRMTGLKQLKLMLGGRDNMDEVSHLHLDDLEVGWVKGLTRLDCSAFPALRRLTVEEEAKIVTIDLRKNADLRKVHISNCKMLEQVNIEELENLTSLFIAKTAINPEAFLASFLPRALTAFDLCGYGLRRDAEIEVLLRSRGYRSVYRDRTH